MDGDQISFDDSVSRRKALFGTVALGSAFALAAQPVCAQTMITTSTEGLDVAAVKVKTKDGKEMMAYRAMPATGTGFGTVLVIQEIFGLHAHIADMCRRFAKVGYYAIAPDLYFREGDATKAPDMQTLMRDFVSKTPEPQVMGDLDATLAFAKGEGKADTAKLGVTGFCWGGRQTWLFDAHNPAVKAAVAWYGPLQRDKTAMTPLNPIDVVDQLHGPVQGLYGGADASISQDSINKMLAALKASSNPAANKSTIKVYPDTPHGFNADYRPSYRKAAAEDGWKLCLAWFKANGVT
jgi:carboxymethylenebutenolidase